MISRRPPKNWPRLLANLWGAPTKYVTVADHERSAEHWLLDAAVYAHDGNIDEALVAARAGIRVLQAKYAG